MIYAILCENPTKNIKMEKDLLQKWKKKRKISISQNLL